MTFRSKAHFGTTVVVTEVFTDNRNSNSIPKNLQNSWAVLVHNTCFVDSYSITIDWTCFLILITCQTYIIMNIIPIIAQVIRRTYAAWQILKYNSWFPTRLPLPSSFRSYERGWYYYRIMQHWNCPGPSVIAVEIIYIFVDIKRFQSSYGEFVKAVQRLRIMKSSLHG